YASALVFSPERSLIRSYFKKKEPKWIKPLKIWDVSSSHCLQTLKGHSSWVISVAFSYNLTQLASASDDKTVKIWDASSSNCLQILKGYSGLVLLVVFSYDLTRLASASDDKTVKIWDTSSSDCL
ncbi:WD40 repeat-like protein, partial [Zopfia rhizophila CBS 207.26]